MLKYFSFYSIVIGAFLIFVLFSSSTEKAGEPNHQQQISPTGLPQMVKAPNLNKAFSFAGEEVPMDRQDTRQRLDRELLKNAYYHSATVLNIKRAKAYFPTIERILAEEGVPDDFKFLAVAESDLSNAVSSAGAKGVWQFMKSTGAAYGLQINSEVDERYHLEKSTRAACKYLKEYKKKFNSWTLAAAAYNMGGPRLSKDLKTQRADNYYQLNLNSETSRYVFRIIALKEILKNQEEFGFYISDEEKYLPIDNVIHLEVLGGIPNWGDFANQHGIDYRLLKMYNPWLISSKLTNSKGKKYLIKVPKK